MTRGTSKVSCSHLVKINGIKWPICIAVEDGPRPVYKKNGFFFSTSSKTLCMSRWEKNTPEMKIEKETRIHSYFWVKQQAYNQYSSFGINLFINRQNMNFGFWNSFGYKSYLTMCTFIWYIIHSFEIMLVDTGVSWTRLSFNFLLDLVKLY